MPPHCDSMDGPVVTAARRALTEGDLAIVLPYVPPKQSPRSPPPSSRSCPSVGSAARSVNSPTGGSLRRWCGCTAPAKGRRTPASR